MSNLVSAEDIERIVGVKRHQSEHVGRIVSAEKMVYILHSVDCRAERADLRTCLYSLLLDRGIDSSRWSGWEDQPVILGNDGFGLVSRRKVQP